MSDTDLVVLANGRTAIALKLIDFDVVSGGVAVWTINDVKRTKQSTSFTQIGAKVYTLPLRLDGMNTKAGGVSVAPQIALLWSWGSPSTVKGKTVEPPHLRLTGNVRTAASIPWVITNLTEVAVVRVNGVIVQYDVTVELTEWVHPTKAKSSAQKAAAKKASKKK